MSIRPVKSVSRPPPPSKAPASSCGAPSASATPPSSIRSCCSTTSATTSPTTISPGFPWHPHRGIETITYVLAGTVEHGDSLGNRGTLGAGDVQWMTAGSGILHQEMPQGDAQGRMHGFQLWANLPASLKMTAPRYQDVAGTRHSRGRRRRRDARARGVRRVLGEDADRSKASPRIRATSTSRSRPAAQEALPVETSRHAFAYVFAGSGHASATRRIRAPC